MSDDKYYNDNGHISRPQSPGAEHVVQDEMNRIFKELFETKGLYQNVRVNEDVFKKYHEPESFIAEFQKRPIVPQSKGEGDDSRAHYGRPGVQPIGRPNSEMSAGFYLPNILLDCPKCSRTTTYLSMVCSGQTPVDAPYPILSKETAQLYTLYYRCAVCRSDLVVFQVFRKGFRFQLTGRSVPYRPAIAKEWPKVVRDIVQDAYAAAAEGDTPAAYYHLRTAIEFFLKNELGLALKSKIDGSELCDRYNAQIDSRLKSGGLPSMISLYSELSAGLHSRDANGEQFAKFANDLLGHFKAKELFAQFSV